MLRHGDYVLAKLDWMRAEGIWPNGPRYLWTDAFGLVLLVSLYRELGEPHWLDEAEQLVREVERVLGRPRGLRIGEAPDRDGQYFHYLAMWLFALARLGDSKPEYRERGIAIARDVHSAFVGYVSYRLLDEEALESEIGEMRELIERQYRTLDVDQDLGLGMMLWLA